MLENLPVWGLGGGDSALRLLAKPKCPEIMILTYKSWDLESNIAGGGFFFFLLGFKSSECTYSGFILSLSGKQRRCWDPPVITCLRELQLHRPYWVSEELAKSLAYPTAVGNVFVVATGKCYWCCARIFCIIPSTHIQKKEARNLRQKCGEQGSKWPVWAPPGLGAAQGKWSTEGAGLWLRVEEPKVNPSGSSETSTKLQKANVHKTSTDAPLCIPFWIYAKIIWFCNTMLLASKRWLASICAGVSSSVSAVLGCRWVCASGWGLMPEELI